MDMLEKNHFIPLIICVALYCFMTLSYLLISSENLTNYKIIAVFYRFNIPPHKMVSDVWHSGGQVIAVSSVFPIIYASFPKNASIPLKAQFFMRANMPFICGVSRGK